MMKGRVVHDENRPRARKAVAMVKKLINKIFKARGIC
jgi:ribosomal protein L31E